MKHFFIGFIIAILALAFLQVAHADYRHDIETPSISVTSYSEYYDAAALAVAFSQSHFDYVTSDLQGSVGWGNIEGRNAIGGSLGKRLDDDMLIHGSIGCSTSGEVCGGGAGITIRFK